MQRDDRERAQSLLHKMNVSQWDNPDIRSDDYCDSETYCSTRTPVFECFFG